MANHDRSHRRTLSFFLQAHANADRDLKLISQRVQSFKVPFDELASSFDREWQHFRKTSLHLGHLWKSDGQENRIRTVVRAQVGHLAANKLQSSFSTPSGLNLDSDAHTQVASWRPLAHKLEPLSVKTCNLEEQCKNDEVDNLLRSGVKFLVDWKEMKLALRPWQNSRRRGKTYPVEKWEPLRRLRVCLMELEATAAASRTPREFFENLRKTEFFENTKTTMNIMTLAENSEKGPMENEVLPLDVPELLESLIWQSESQLDQLGVQKGFLERTCSTIRSWNHHDQPHSSALGVTNDVLILLKEAGRAANELDLRLASVLNSTDYRHQGDTWGKHLLIKEAQCPDTRSIVIVTTASLPWMTGTAINPLFRAAYLAKSGKQNVTLLVPWLSKKDQELVYPNQITFDAPQNQENYIREWLSSRVSFQADFRILFYPGKFSKSKRSILAVGDISQFVPDGESDVAVLEEPEHLTWYHHGARWTRKFRHVVGVVHTNYLEYVKREKNGPLQAALLKYVNNWVTNIYCHKVIRLSAATQKLPKSIVCNVHGVSPKFFEIGQKLAAERHKGHLAVSGAYFIGKMVWGKGYQELLHLWAKHKDDLEGLQLDVFGNGEDSAAIQAEAKKSGLKIKFQTGRDHADSSLHGYKIFINPSVSDVVCTTTAEALAMGKIVVCADHPSNAFFKCFSNCFMYTTSEQFAEKVKQAMKWDPVTLSADEKHVLSWEAATERFWEAAELGKLAPRELRGGLWRVGEIVEYWMFVAHYCLSGMEVARLASGAIPRTMHLDDQQRRDLGLLLSSSSPYAHV